MTASIIAPYGLWPSPVTGLDVANSDAVVEWVDFVEHLVCWIENLPLDDGRSALMAYDGERITELLPGRRHVRSRIIEYGARPWAPVGSRLADGVVFSDAADQRVRRWLPDGAVIPLTPAEPTARYGDFAVWREEVWCLREDLLPGRMERRIVAIPLGGEAAENSARIRDVAASHRFMTGPKLSADGGRVAWLGWDHPDMPWESTEAMVATVSVDGGVDRPQAWIGTAGESIAQVEWSRSETDLLYALTDRTGWWNPVAVRPDRTVRPLCPRPEDFADALWRIGLRWFASLRDGRSVVIHGEGDLALGVLGPDGVLKDVDTPFTEWASVAVDGHRVAAIAGGPHHRRTVVLVDAATGGWEIIRPAPRVHDELAVVPIERSFVDGDGRPVHAYLHSPFHPDVVAPPGELPPWVVFVHGGPTYRSHLTRRQEITFLTSRGIGVVDVQHSGSTGRGRAYRERLNGQWGVLEVADCAAVVRAMVAAGLVDPNRVAIRGGSAGGWTAAVSLAAEPDLYAAACSYYPVLDLPSWHGDGTHDFESHYLTSMIGGLPEAAESYRLRSPSYRASDMRGPLLVLHGLADTICRPSQVETVSGARVQCLFFEGEGHGFRKAATVEACLNEELRLYIDVFCGERQVA
jgi:dipeptidyl aminopeptidase/acylaminoacyl peptidase